MMLMLLGAWAVRAEKRPTPTPKMPQGEISRQANRDREASRVLTVPRWQPHDFIFESRERYPNPFTVPFAATVSGPSGAKFSIPGFYDGKGRWKIRFAPDSPGKWVLKTYSKDPSLNGAKVIFQCVKNADPRVHGPLKVDPKHPRHFVHADGTRFFHLGYECDWLWALDMNRADLPTLDPFLDKLAAHGFNCILLNAFAYDTNWRPGKSAPEDLGPPLLFPWEGTNDKPDHGRFDLAYWHHYDRVIEAMNRRGIVAHIMIKVFNKHVRWPAVGSPEEDQYIRWLIARYAAYPNVVWDFSKESFYEKNVQVKIGWLQRMRQDDPYHRLLTLHDDDKLYDREDGRKPIDFRTDQQHDNFHGALLAQAKTFPGPLVNAEFGYEHGPGGPNDKTYGHTNTPEELARRAWEICMAGGYPVYYYTYTAWDVVRTADTPPGYAYFRNLRKFFEKSEYWLMKPADRLVSEGYCLADPGRAYLVFLNEAKPFTLKIEGVSGKLQAMWFNPFTGKEKTGGMMGNGSIQYTPPAPWGKGPVALRVFRPGFPPAKGNQEAARRAPGR